MNSDVIFFFQPKNALAWLYWELRIGVCSNGLWDFGYSTAGGGSPVCVGEYETKEQTIDAGIKHFKTIFNKPFEKGQFVTLKQYQQGQKAFRFFLNRRVTLNKSQTKHLTHIADTGTNYVQTSLF
jgi:hypothetical protein